MSPSGATSYNGWPVSSDPSAISVDKGFSVNGVTFPGGMRSGDVSTVLGYVFAQMDARVERLVPGWCWGYYYKPNTNNPNVWSNHASATAGDFNAPNHPNGGSQYGGFSSAQVAEIRRILAEVQGSIQWGADYSGTKDPMHFEVNVSSSTLARVAAQLPQEDDDMGLTPDDRQWIQDTINASLTTALTKTQYVSTDDKAMAGNPNKFTIASGVGRAITLASYPATGQTVAPKA